MALFTCTKCGAIDNTALGDYHAQKSKYYQSAYHEYVDFEPLCSECSTGKWHDEFQKVIAHKNRPSN